MKKLLILGLLILPFNALAYDSIESEAIKHHQQPKLCRTLDKAIRSKQFELSVVWDMWLMMLRLNCLDYLPKK